MAVPDTNSFSLVDVCDELNLTGSDRNLVECFSSANNDYFNDSYSGDKDNLLNFRDYGSHNGSSSFNVDVSVQSDLFSGDTVECEVIIRDTSGNTIDSYNYSTSKTQSHTFSISESYYMEIQGFTVNRLRAKPRWSDDGASSWNYTAQTGTYSGAESFIIRKSDKK